MKRLFEKLYEEEIIDFDTIISWSNDTENNAPGKIDCLFEVNDWLSKVKEEMATPEDEDDAEAEGEDSEVAGKSDAPQG